MVCLMKREQDGEGKIPRACKLGLNHLANAIAREKGKSDVNAGPERRHRVHQPTKPLRNMRERDRKVVHRVEICVTVWEAVCIREIEYREPDFIRKGVCRRQLSNLAHDGVKGG